MPENVVFITALSIDRVLFPGYIVNDLTSTLLNEYRAFFVCKTLRRYMVQEKLRFKYL